MCLMKQSAHLVLPCQGDVQAFSDDLRQPTSARLLKIAIREAFVLVLNTATGLKMILLIWQHQFPGAWRDEHKDQQWIRVK